ncbi:hypothetical protein CEP88_19950 [Roseobacter denitrificans]|nr:c-type cytochrome [Roseobacter denitrificans]AVL55092.1 hypothetical protein CEP88_19950 [Roseobacter denitrificans]
MPRFSSLIMAACVFLAACSPEDRVSRGAVLYSENCAICHGGDLRGGGGIGVVGLNKVPTDLTTLAVRSGGDFPRGEVLALLNDYAAGVQPGRLMRPFAHLTSQDTERIKTEQGRTRIPAPQAALLAYLEASQLP